MAFNPKPKIAEHMLIVMDESTHEEHLSQPLQTNNIQFKKTVTFLTVNNGILNVTGKSIKFYFTVSNKVDNFSVISIPLGAYEIESLDKETKRYNIEEGNFTESYYPFKAKLNFRSLI